MKTLLIAHRGAQIIAPENTLSAFALALHKGFRAVECDVQLTRDGQLVVIHDETLNRTTNGSGWVSRHTYTQIKNLKLEKGEHIPHVEEVVQQVVKHAQQHLIIEIKADSEEHAKKVAKALSDYLNSLPATHLRLIEVHSFWYAALKTFKLRSPLVRTAAIIGGGYDAVEIITIAQKCIANGVNLNYEFVSRHIVRDCHAAGLFVDTWAIPDGSVMKRLRRFGLDAIVESYTGKKITTSV